MTTTLQPPAWVESSQTTGTLILRLCGELDLESAGAIERIVSDAIPTAYAVKLDLSGLTFCDSSGLTMLLAVQRVADAAGNTLIVGNVPPIVARLFEISGLDQILNVTG